ncbi:MAG: hypothetical protein AAB534_03530 [Patescibacteria group bacterium]
MAKGTERRVLYRVEKFEIHPTPEQFAVLLTVSRNLLVIWNEALAERSKCFDEFIAPIYAEMKGVADSERVKELRKKLKDAFKEHSVTLFDQINTLTGKRANDSTFAVVPRSWQEETLDALDGGFKSFVALRKNSDHDARPPRPRFPEGFSEIPGRFGFKVGGGVFTISCAKIAPDVELTFPIPAYQQEKLSRALEIKKFTLFRDERNLKRAGRFWVSIAYEIEMPATGSFVPEDAVYVSLGASSLGIVSLQGKEVVKLWRPDLNLKPQVDAIEARMKANLVAYPAYSRKWKRFREAKRRVETKMARQQKQDQREVAVKKILRHGIHVVVTEVVVRSKNAALADSSKPERGGSPKGLNWSAQNTGSFARLVAHLEEKAKERGGTVRKHKVVLAVPPPCIGHENKIWMAERLRESFLQSLRMGVVE